MTKAAFKFWNGLASVLLSLSGLLLWAGKSCADRATKILEEDNIK